MKCGTFLKSNVIVLRLKTESIREERPVNDRRIKMTD